MKNINRQALNDTALASRKLTGLTSVWPSNDSYAFIFTNYQNVRSYRLRAIKTAGATAGATVKYTLDAPNEADAEQALTFAPADVNNTNLPYNELFDGEWTEWIDLDWDTDLLPLQRIDFLPTADTWTVIMEVA